MSIWQFLENRAVSDQGKTIQRVTENTRISSDNRQTLLIALSELNN